MSNEWYTPAEYIYAVREVLGEIDIDPASCEFANKTVQAKHYYTIEQNGLMLPWYGNVFCNPPYGKTSIGDGSNLEQFTNKLIGEYQRGNVTQAILLIPANTATSWFPPLWQYPICFPDFRIRFYTVNGPSSGASFGSIFIYLGSNEVKFFEVFCRFGTIVKQIYPQSRKRYIPLGLWDVTINTEEGSEGAA
jgi:DNA N-6-adenine-methyltransferase (Dam)